MNRVVGRIRGGILYRASACSSREKAFQISKTEQTGERDDSHKERKVNDFTIHF